MFPSSGHVRQAGLGGGDGERGQVTRMLVTIILVLWLSHTDSFLAGACKAECVMFKKDAHKRNMICHLLAFSGEALRLL